MIYDCFLFNNELDLLEIRLNELSGVVDKFVLVESTVTHSCKPKRLHFEENKHRYRKFKDKIIHIIVRDTPDVNLGWIVNDYQFCQMIRGLKGCNPEDVILFGDLDEIPRAEKVMEWKDKPGKLKIFEQVLSQYYLNLVEYNKGPWYGTRMTKYKHLLSYKSMWIAKYSKHNVVIPDGGWHFSYIGGMDKIREKISNMTHQEYNNDMYNTPENILKAIYNQTDFLKLGYKLRIEDTDLLPIYVQKNIRKYNDLIIEKSFAGSRLHILINVYLDTRKIFRLLYRNIRRAYTHSEA